LVGLSLREGNRVEKKGGKKMPVLTFAEYEEGLKEGKLLGLKCKDCKKITCHPMPVCQWCGSRNLEPLELSGAGELMTFTVMRVPPEGFEDDGIYIPCLVKTKEGPWVVGRLDHDSEKAIQELIGSEVRMKGASLYKGDKFSGGPHVCPLFEINGMKHEGEKIEKIKKVCVIGIGVMGRGIAQVCAQAGYDTSVVGKSDETLEKKMSDIKNSLSRAIKRGKITQAAMDKIMERITGTARLEEGAKGADFVIEAVPERLDVKQDIFRELDEICPEDTILGSNTSTIPIASLGAVTKRPDRVIGTHFFNPAPVMRGVEVIKSISTSEDTVKKTLEFIKSLGKKGVAVKDSPGFLVNRISTLILNEAAKIYQENLASKEDIDQILKLSLNWPMGPFQLLDLVGIDTAVDALNTIYNETGWDRYKPAPPLTRLVKVGWTGRKAGKGFHEYK
jgi:3-hydroxybutyryl-CoA dehydrogenase